VLKTPRPKATAIIGSFEKPEKPMTGGSMLQCILIQVKKGRYGKLGCYFCGILGYYNI
jgi:hypothetical protein